MYLAPLFLSVAYCTFSRGRYTSIRQILQLGGAVHASYTDSYDSDGGCGN